MDSNTISKNSKLTNENLKMIMSMIGIV